MGAAADEKPYEVDLTKPLVFQVGNLLDRYDDWVHKPIVTKKGPRLFESDYMEMLTNTFWWMIPIIWLPVVACLELKAMSVGILPSSLPKYMLLGIFIWTAVEYVLHRFLFHWRTTGYWTNTLHYLLHGCHHKHPQDPYRLVFPPALAAVLAPIIVYPFTWILPMPVVYAAAGGGLLGYIIYDVTHFWVHFGFSTSLEPLYTLRRYHMAHHFKHPSLGFGITSSLWDRVFGTYPAPDQAKTAGSSKERVE